SAFFAGGSSAARRESAHRIASYADRQWPCADGGPDRVFRGNHCECGGSMGSGTDPRNQREEGQGTLGDHRSLSRFCATSVGGVGIFEERALGQFRLSCVQRATSKNRTSADWFLAAIWGGTQRSGPRDSFAHAAARSVLYAGAGADFRDSRVDWISRRDSRQTAADR